MINDSKYKIKNAAVVTTLIGSLLINNFIVALKKNVYHGSIVNYSYETINEYTLEDLKSFIYNSPNLTQEEKDFLYNEDFLNDILPFVNESIASRLRYQSHFNNIDIQSYGGDGEEQRYAGYYNPIFPNSIFINNYQTFEAHKDTIGHEFVHLCQKIDIYNVITEACAEIISWEYFPDAKASAYSDQVRLVKKLMEIIGPAPIWHLNFTADFTQVENVVKPYLTSDEYNEFVKCLSFEFGATEDNRVKFNRLDELLAIMYKNKFNDDITNNEVISALDNPMCEVVRYYFNKRYMDREHSYYINRHDKVYSMMSYEEAMENNLFMAYAVRYDEITYEEAMDIVNNRTGNISRKVDYTNHNIILKRSINKGIRSYFTGIIDGVTYDLIDVDELVGQGVIDVTYYSVLLQHLSAYEYLNGICPEGATIYTMYSSSDLIPHEDYIEGIVPKKVYLEPISMNQDITRTLEKSN